MEDLPGTALLIIDVQNDFLEGGSLAVPGGKEIMPEITRLLQDYRFARILASQDSHPSNHISFADNQPGCKPFDEIEVSFQAPGEPVAHQRQQLWPRHCVQGTVGWALHDAIVKLPIDKVIAKGYNAELDSYSAFVDSFGYEETGLEEDLRSHHIERVVCVGLAEDYCVFETALAAGKHHFKTFILQEGVRGIKPMSEEQLERLSAAGVQYIQRAELAAACLKTDE